MRFFSPPKTVCASALKKNCLCLLNEATQKERERKSRKKEAIWLWKNMKKVKQRRRLQAT
jgi:hypothetical protein